MASIWITVAKATFIVPKKQNDKRQNDKRQNISKTIFFHTNTVTSFLFCRFVFCLFAKKVQKMVKQQNDKRQNDKILVFFVGLPTSPTKDKRQNTNSRHLSHQKVKNIF